MKLCTSGSRKVLCVVLFLLAPSLVFANSVTVDCTGATPGSFPSITAALASLPRVGPNSIFVASNCTEDVLIVNFTELSINATPGTATITSATATRRVLNITDSTGVFIDGLNFSGGRGVFVNNSSNVQFGDGGIQGSSVQGLTTFNSIVDVFGSSDSSLFTVQNNARSGISGQGGVLSLDGGVTVTNNGRVGVSMLTGHLVLNGGDGGATIPDNVISNNGSVGVSVENSSECDAGGGNDVLNNGTNGVQVIHTSTIIWAGGGTITGNKGVGVHIGETSHGEFDTVTISGNGASSTGIISGFGAAGGMEVVENSDMFIDGGVNVANNLSTGIYVTESSVLSSLGGNTINGNHGNGFLVTALGVAHFFAADSGAGNTKEGFECDSSSVLIGASGLGNERCANVRIR